MPAYRNYGQQSGSAYIQQPGKTSTTLPGSTTGSVGEYDASKNYGEQEIDAYNKANNIVPHDARKAYPGDTSQDNGGYDASKNYQDIEADKARQPVTTPPRNIGYRNPNMTPSGAAVAAPPAAPPQQAAAAPGVLGGDSYLEELYKQRQSGNDPYYNQLRERGTVAINNQASARGGFNSSGAMNAIGDYRSGIDAREFHDRADLAAAASGERRGRFSDMWDRSKDVSGAHRDAMAPLDKAGQAMGDTDLRNMQLQLDKSGIDPKVQQQILANMFGIVNTGASIAGSIGGV